MAHDPYCTYAKTPKEVEWHLCACCAWVKEIRNDERFATVEGAVYIASQSGASPELVQLLSSMYERPEVPGADEMRLEAARELTQLAQQMGMIP